MSYDFQPESSERSPETRDAQAAAEKRSLLRGLLWMALLTLLLSMAHAGWSRAFVPGWWRQW